MTSIQIGRTEGGLADEVTTQGVWWLAGSDRDPVPGTVTFTSTGLVRLELLDHLPDDPASGTHVIHGRRIRGGRPGGKEMTLLDAVLRSTEETSWDSDGHAKPLKSQTWVASSYVSGGLLDDPDSTRFTAVTVKTRRLGKWTGIPEAAGNKHSERQRVLSVEIPSPIVCAIPGVGTVRLGWGETSHWSEMSARIEIIPYWHVELDVPQTMDELYRDILTPLLLWMTFVTGTGDRFQEVTLWRSSGPTPSDQQSFLWYTGEWSDDLPRRVEPPAHEYLLPLKRIMTDLPKVLAAWFDMYRIAGWPMTEFMLPYIRSNTAYEEERFLGVVRSMESFHRLLYGGDEMPTDQFNDLINGVLERAQNADERKFLSERLKYANAMTQRKRLRNLVVMSSPAIQSLASKNKKLISKAIKLRNDFTHGAAKRASDSDLWEMSNATTLLEVVMTSVWLKGLGLDDETVDDSLRGSYAWGFVRAVLEVN